MSSHNLRSCLVAKFLMMPLVQSVLLFLNPSLVKEDATNVRRFFIERELCLSYLTYISYHVPPSRENGSPGGHIACILDRIKQTELIEWLVKRVVFQKNSQGESMQLHLQFEAEAERVVNLVIKVQSRWRRLKSLRCAKEKAKQQCEKIFVRENNVFANRNIRTDEGRLEKPKFLGNNDLRDPYL